MSLRIGMILDTDFPPDSRVESEALSLVESGFEVFLFSLSYKNRNKQETIKGFKVVRYPAGKLIYKLSALAYTFPFYHHFAKSRVEDFIKNYSIQCLHIHDMQIARAVFDANSGKLPIVLDLHENRPEIMRVYRHVNTFQGKLLISPKTWDKYQSKYIEEADDVVVVTHQAKEVILEQKLKTHEKIVVVPNTIHQNIFYEYPINLKIKNGFMPGFNILYLGDTGLRRGTDTAIEAVNILSRRIPDMRLILVGDNKEDSELIKLANKLGIDDKIHFEGWKDVSLFPSYIDIADVCISPLKRNKHHDTTFANKIFQYMAGGKPLVVSDCPPQAEVVTDAECGLVHIANNAEDLATKIIKLYQDPDLRAKMGINSKKAVRSKWNWGATSKDLISKYREIEASVF